MKTIGIIAEFNPFHNGHSYLVSEAKRLTKADFCVVVMSGNFVQRGAPAILDKYTRTRMALLNGVDLVIELPVVYATASAEYFSRAAVCLLNRLGVVDCLCFGSECGDVEVLKSAARFLIDENQTFQKELKKNLKSGMSYPKARGKSVDYSGQSRESVDDNIFNVINQPNNILGIEYIKALDLFGSSIEPVTIKRRGIGYHDEQAESATAIRREVEERVRGGGTNCFDAPGIITTPPAPERSPGWARPSREGNLSSLFAMAESPVLRFLSDFSELLYYKLTLHAETGYSQFFDVSNDLSDKIKKNLPKYKDYEDFIYMLKSKNFTYMRVSRCLNHVLLDIYGDDIVSYMDNGYVFYARLLGFNEKAGGLLKAIKNHSTIPLISKLADADELLGEIGMKMLRKDIQAAHIYNRGINEYTAPIVKV